MAETQQKDQWITTTERFVAFFDIMGFKDRLIRFGHERIGKDFELITNLRSFIELGKINTDAPGANSIIDSFKQNPVRTAVFSDSILFVSSGISDDSFKSFTYYCAIFTQICFKHGIPLKGGIAAGELTADPKKSVYYGTPLIDAYELEESLEFYGVAMHHSAEKVLSKHEIEGWLRLDGIIEKAVPVKGSGKIKHLILNPFQKSTKDIDPKKVLSEFYDQCSGSVRRYVDNTASVYGYEAEGTGRYDFRNIEITSP